MKAFLLCAGQGTRLRPLTDSVPKCLVPIQGIPLLRIWLDQCSANGIFEVLINVHAFADQVFRFVAAYEGPVEVTISEESVLLGSAGTIADNREWIGGDRSFFVLYGDVLNNVDLAKLAGFHQSHGRAATLGVYAVPNPTECGIVELGHGDVIERFAEKPQNPTTNLAFSGIMIMDTTLLRHFPSQRPADLGFQVLPQLAHQAVAYTIREYLVDIGTMRKYKDAQQHWPGLKPKA